MRDTIIGILALVLTGVGIGVGARNHTPHLKDTGECQFIGEPLTHRYWFLRPNNEIFEMYFDNPPIILRLGVTMSHIYYTDDNADMRHFVKAEFKPLPLGK